MDLEKKEVIASSKGWDWNVYVQGNPENVDKTIVTIHDLGCNHTAFHPFIQHPIMAEVTKRSVWVHLEVPGQGDHSPDLPTDFKFPSMQELAEEMKVVIDSLKIKHFVGIGEGAGANILARYAMTGDQRVLGVCLIHCTGTTAGIMENVKDKFIKWKLDQSGMNSTAEGYLVLHRFGSIDKAQNKEELEHAIQEFCHRLYNKVNSKNLKAFLNSFLNRTNINAEMSKLRGNVLVVTGTKASFNHTVQHLYEALLAARTTLEERRTVEYVPFSDVANVLEEKVEKLAECFQYFLQGAGYATHVPIMGARKQSFTRGASMGDFDLPMSRRLSQVTQVADYTEKTSCANGDD